MSDTQIKTLEDFKEEVAIEGGYSSYQTLSEICITEFKYELEAYKRFHAYQLECKDKEIESYETENYRLLDKITILETHNSDLLSEIEDLKKMVLHESKEFQKTARELKDGYDKLISEKNKEIEERDNYIHLANGKILEQTKEIEELKKEVERLKTKIGGGIPRELLSKEARDCFDSIDKALGIND